MRRKKNRSKPELSRELPLAEKSQGNLLVRVIFYLAAILLFGTAFVWLLAFVTVGRKPDNPPDGAEDRLLSLAAEHDRFVLPAVTPSRFRNVSKTVGYVGNHACMECHRDEHESYLKTTHSRSLAAVDVSREPPDGEFHHELSGRHYRIYREGTTLKLREFIRDSSGQEVVLVDRAAQYSLGSGNYARMYLVKVGDFLIEAPMTWYPRRECWGMSAGYEKDPHQAGFGREIDSNCLHCHAGRVETIGGAGQRLNVTEMAIGCERCHGPGALHVQERREKLPIRGGIDDSIVNLRHLSREMQEDVCSQCHLSASADVNLRGRSSADFRPGMKLSDFRISYRIDRPESAMTVSGQIEQMRLSRCYIESKAMTCATCHDPHARPDDAEKMDYYRNKCLSCHQAKSCRLPAEVRKEKQAQDNCIVCHMPRGPTDIPHFSFTHHRVGIHTDKPQSDKLTEADRLVPVVDESHLPEFERMRLLGLANDIFAGKLVGGLNDESRDDPSYRALSKVFEQRGQQMLEQVRSQGVRDPELDMFFSRMNWRKNPELCIGFAESALNSSDVLPATRHAALYNLASSHFDQRRYDQATRYLEELVKIERNEISLMLLAVCNQRKGNLVEAVRLVNEAILDSPERADLHIYLASIYQKMGKPDDADSHLQWAKRLSQQVPQLEAASRNP